MANYIENNTNPFNTKGLRRADFRQNLQLNREKLFSTGNCDFNPELARETLSFLNRALSNIELLRNPSFLNEARPDLFPPLSPELLKAACATEGTNWWQAATETGKKLASFAEKNANGDGKHCFQYVAEALEQIGVELEGLSAYQAADQLAAHPAMKEITGLTINDLPNLPAGAIVVWNRGNGHEHGHISISLGDGREASDVIREQLTDYGTDFRVFIPVADRQKPQQG